MILTLNMLLLHTGFIKHTHTCTHILEDTVLHACNSSCSMFETPLHPSMLQILKLADRLYKQTKSGFCKSKYQNMLLLIGFTMLK